MHPKLLSKLRFLHYFSKTWLNIWRKSWWSSLFWWNISILQIFFSCILYLLLLGKTPQPCMAGNKLCLWAPTFLFFPWNTSDYLYLLKTIIRVIFFSNIFTESSKIKENIQPCTAGDCPLGKFICLLKLWRILKLQIQLSRWTVLTTKMIFYKKKLRYHSDTKISRYFSPATMAD